MDPIFAFLRGLDLFSPVADDDLAAVAEACTPAEVAAGQVLCHEGQPGSQIYILREGQVKVWKDHGTADRIFLAEYGPGKVFGELALIDNLPRSATVVCDVHTRVLEVAQTDFVRLITGHPCVCYCFMKSIAAMIRTTTANYAAGLKERQRALEDSNQRLRQEIEAKTRAESELKTYQNHLTELVEQRTRELAHVNTLLRGEIEKRKVTEKELRDALAKVKVLGGLLPVCTVCHKVRDDDGYWGGIDAFFRKHSQADVQASICPACSKAKYSKFYEK